MDEEEGEEDWMREERGAEEEEEGEERWRVKRRGTVGRSRTTRGAWMKGFERKALKMI